MFARSLRPAVSLLLLMTALLGVVYPLVVTGVAQLVFPWQANGSLIQRDGRIIGSTLIGQNFTDPKYFWGRPSATTPQAYDATASTASNLGPLNPALIDAIKARVQTLRAADPGNAPPIPVELVTASASGLDPHISVAGAQFQSARVAKPCSPWLRTCDRLECSRERSRTADRDCLPAMHHRRASSGCGW